MVGLSGIELSFSRRFEIPSTREGAGRIRCLESLKGWGTVGLGGGSGINGVITVSLVGLDAGVS